MLDIKNKKILIVGGGAIAFEKLGRICDLDCDIFVVATRFSDDILDLMRRKNINHIKQAYESQYLEGVDVVVAAVDNHELQEKIFLDASARKILCNAVDLVDFCHFIFPSVIRRGDLVVTVSTSGVSPATAKHIKSFFEKIIPNSVSEFLKQMRQKRIQMPKGKERMKLLDEMAKDFVEKNFYNI